MPANGWFQALLVLFALGLGGAALGEEPPKPIDYAAKLAEVDKKIAAQPDDPFWYGARPQLLAKLGKYDEAYAAAQAAMKKFAAADKELAWIMLDTLEVDGHTVGVHFNMGDSERTPPADGIVRPISFRIYAKDGRSILRRFDFEQGYSQGKPFTGCFGETSAAGHANFGPVDPQLPYSKIRIQAIKLIAQMVKE